MPTPIRFTDLLRRMMALITRFRRPNARSRGIRVTIVLGLGLLFASALSGIAAPAANPDFDALLDRYYEEYRELYPVDVAISGDPDPRYDAVWPDDLTPEFRAKVEDFCTRYLAGLGAFERGSLSPDDRLSVDILRWNLEMRRERDRHFFYLTPVNQMSCALLDFAQMGSGSYVHPFKTPADYRHFLARAGGFGAWVDSAIANMREGIARSITVPGVLIDRVIGQLEPLARDDPEQNLFFKPLAMLPPGADDLRADYLAGIRNVILPAYARMRKFLQEEYRPHCRNSSGLGDLPGGRKAYAWCVRAQTTTDLTAEEIHSIGLDEVAAIRHELDDLQRRVGFKGTYREFLDDVFNDPKLKPFRTVDDVLNGYRAIQHKIDAALPRFFRTVPATRFEIRQTEAFRAKTASPEYVPGTADGSRPGIFYVPILNPKRKTVVYMTDLFLHEAIPGHHFQLSLALENRSLPKFRRIDANNAFVEGWALYCERLGEEMGVYDDEWQRLGLLLDEMHRAVRLVVDTGLHAEGWSRERAMEYQAEQEGGTPEDQASDIERYMACPGQALGYKIGQRKILELRHAAERQLGTKFDLREFHEQVLGAGAMPLAELEARILEWAKVTGSGASAQSREDSAESADARS